MSTIRVFFVASEYAPFPKSSKPFMLSVSNTQMSLFVMVLNTSKVASLEFALSVQSILVEGEILSTGFLYLCKCVRILAKSSHSLKII